MQVNKKILFLFGIFILCISACQPKELRPKEYINYIKSKKSNLYKKREIGEYRFEVLYQPIEYKIATQLKGNLDKEKIKNLKTDMEGMDYFTLKISPINSNKSILKYNIQTEEEYQARLAYFSFGMQNDIYLEIPDNKIDCSLYHFERAYDLSNFRIFDLAFENKNNNKDKTIVIHSDFFGSGPIKFKFNENDLNDLPVLLIK